MKKLKLAQNCNLFLRKAQICKKITDEISTKKLKEHKQVEISNGIAEKVGVIAKKQKNRKKAKITKIQFNGS